MTLRPAQSGHPELAGQPPSALGDNEEAIKHFTQALGMEENSRDRVSRGGRCSWTQATALGQRKMPKPPWH